MQHNAEVACSSEKTSRKPEVDSTEATLAALHFAEDAIDLLCEVEKVQTSTRPCLQAATSNAVALRVLSTLSSPS